MWNDCGAVDSSSEHMLRTDSCRRYLLCFINVWDKRSCKIY